MADDQDKKWVDYSDDPAQYNLQLVSQWRRHFNKFKSRIEENTQHYNNYSQDLADRQADETFSRSCLYISVINPAILARTANISKLVWSVKEPIEPTAKKGTPQETAGNVKSLIHDVLNEDKYQLTFMKQKIAQELYPIAFLKICEHEEEETVLSIEPDYFKDEFGIPVVGEEFRLGDFKDWQKKKTKSRPTVVLYTMDMVPYDPSATSWDDLQYIGTVTPLTFGQIVARKKTQGYEFDENELKEKGQYYDEDEDDFQKRIKSASQQETKEKEGDPRKYKVVELFHKIEKPDGTILNKITTTCGRVKLKDVDYPYEGLQIPDPFIPLIGYPVLNQIEGLSTADLMNHVAHGINDFFNLLMDSGKYGLFPPILQDARTRILNEMVIAPGAVWDIQVPKDGSVPLDKATKPLYNVTPVTKEFFAIIDALFERAEVVGSAPEDILMGVATDPEEKATKTKARVAGASTRIAGISLLMDVEVFKSLGRIIHGIVLNRLKVGETYTIDQGFDEKGNPQTLDLTLERINGLFAFDVPHLSGLAEREMKLAKLQEIFAQVAQSPIAQHPVMVMVFYNYLSKIAELSLVKKEFDEIFSDKVMQMLQSLPAPAEPGAGGTLGGGEGIDPAAMLDQMRNLTSGGV